MSFENLQSRDLRFWPNGCRQITLARFFFDNTTVVGATLIKVEDASGTISYELPASFRSYVFLDIFTKITITWGAESPISFTLTSRATVIVRHGDAYLPRALEPYAGSSTLQAASPRWEAFKISDFKFGALNLLNRSGSDIIATSGTYVSEWAGTSVSCADGANAVFDPTNYTVSRPSPSAVPFCPADRTSTAYLLSLFRPITYGSFVFYYPPFGSMSPVVNSTFYNPTDGEMWLLSARGQTPPSGNTFVGFTILPTLFKAGLFIQSDTQILGGFPSPNTRPLTRSEGAPDRQSCLFWEYFRPWAEATLPV